MGNRYKQSWNNGIFCRRTFGFNSGYSLSNSQLLKITDNTNLRPDFQILVYPVISMQDSLTHLGSRTNLLGNNPSKKLIDEFSNELQVDENTPPAYITQAADDKVVDVDNSIVYFEALRHHNVPVEMHIYPKGNHGFVLKQPTEEWMKPIFTWMANISLVK